MGKVWAKRKPHALTAGKGQKKKTALDGLSVVGRIGIEPITR